MNTTLQHHLHRMMDLEKFFAVKAVNVRIKKQVLTAQHGNFYTFRNLLGDVDNGNLHRCLHLLGVDEVVVEKTRLVEVGEV